MSEYLEQLETEHKWGNRDEVLRFGRDQWERVAWKHLELSPGILGPSADVWTGRGEL